MIAVGIELSLPQAGQQIRHPVHIIMHHHYNSVHDSVDEYALRVNKINYFLLLQNQVRLSSFKWPIDEGDWPSQMSPPPPGLGEGSGGRVDSNHRTPSLHCLITSAATP